MTNAKKSHENNTNQLVKADTDYLDKIKKLSQHIVELSPEPKDENEVQGMMYVDNVMYELFKYRTKTKEIFDYFDGKRTDLNAQEADMKEDARSLGKQNGVIDNDVQDQAEHWEALSEDIQLRLNKVDQVISFLNEVISVPAIGRVYDIKDYEISKTRRSSYIKKGTSKKYVRKQLS